MLAELDGVQFKRLCFEEAKKSSGKVSQAVGKVSKALISCTQPRQGPSSCTQLRSMMDSGRARCTTNKAKVFMH